MLKYDFYSDIYIYVQSNWKCVVLHDLYLNFQDQLFFNAFIKKICARSGCLQQISLDLHDPAVKLFLFSLISLDFE